MVLRDISCMNLTEEYSKDCEVLYYENFDLESIVTPVKADILEQLL